MGGNSFLSLLDTFLLDGVPQALFTESLHEFVVGGIQFERMEPRLTGIGEFSLLGIDVAEVFIDHRIISHEGGGSLEFSKRFCKHAGFK